MNDLIVITTIFVCGLFGGGGNGDLPPGEELGFNFSFSSSMCGGGGVGELPPD